MAFFVNIRTNGKVYGKLGPYAERSDALLEAAALKRPGLTAAVVGAPARPRTRRNWAQVAWAVVGPIVAPIAKKWAKSKADQYLAADQATRIQMIRQFARANIPMSIALRNDTLAGQAADGLAYVLSVIDTPEGKQLLGAAAGAAAASMQQKTKANRKR
jgi:hypothetical protein